MKKIRGLTALMILLFGMGGPRSSHAVEIIQDELDGDASGIMIYEDTLDQELEVIPTFIMDKKRSAMEVWALGLQDKIDMEPLSLPDGRLVEDYAFHRREDGVGFMVGTAGENVDITISKILDIPGGQHEILVIFRGKTDRKVKSPEVENVGIWDLNPSPMEFKKTGVSANTPIRVAVLLDASGSMRGVWHTVIQAAQLFLKALPIGAQCKIALFNETVDVVADWMGCNQASEALKHQTPGGGTDISQALKMALSSYPPVHGGALKAQNVTILVSDGVDTANLANDKPTILADKKKNKATVFAYYAGDVNSKSLEPIPDYELMALGEIEESLNAYFKGIDLFLKKQDVFLVKAGNPVSAEQVIQAVEYNIANAP